MNAMNTSIHSTFPKHFGISQKLITNFYPQLIDFWSFVAFGVNDDNDSRLIGARG